MTDFVKRDLHLLVAVKPPTRRGTAAKLDIRREKHAHLATRPLHGPLPTRRPADVTSSETHFVRPRKSNLRLGGCNLNKARLAIRSLLPGSHGFTDDRVALGICFAQVNRDLLKEEQITRRGGRRHIALFKRPPTVVEKLLKLGE